MQIQLVPLVFVGAIASAQAQQQTWTPLTDFGVTGDFIGGAATQPRVLSPGLFGSPTYEGTYADGAFETRAVDLAPNGAVPQASAYDPVGVRSVVYMERITVVVVGGGVSESSLAIHDGARWSYVPAPSIPGRTGTVLAHDPVTGGLLLFGGRFPAFPQGIMVDDVWRLDGETWTFMPTAHAPSPRSHAAMAVEPNTNRLVLFGGRASQIGGAVFDDTWRWTGSDWEFVPTTLTPPARTGHTLATDPFGAGVILYGGNNAAHLGSGIPLVTFGDAWLFNGSSWTPLPSPLGGVPMDDVSFVNDGDDLLLFGRTGTQPGVVHGLRWTGSGWDEVYTSAPIDELVGSGFALDTARNEIVRFGGRASYEPSATWYRDETWVFDGEWKQAQPTNVPPARDSSPLAFDPLRGETVMFGGSGPSGFLADTWVWDGSDWQQRFPANSPPAHYDHALAFDPSRGGVVLHNGGAPTWLWDGVDWTLLATTGATEPNRGSLAFDSARNVLCYYADGGSSEASTLWELQGSAWVLVDATAPPFGRLTFDPVTGALALFGTHVRNDFVGGVWVASGQSANGRDYMYDTSRGGLLALSTRVALSTTTPARHATYGSGCGIGVTPTLGFDRLPRLGANMQAVVRAGQPGSLTYVFFGFSPQNLPFGGCTQWISNTFLNVSGVADSAGWATIPTHVPPVPALAGIKVFAQAFVAYPDPFLGLFGLSNGHEVEIGT